MGLTTELAMDLWKIQINEKDKEQLKTLIIDFFAIVCRLLPSGSGAAYGFLQERRKRQQERLRR